MVRQDPSASQPSVTCSGSICSRLSQYTSPSESLVTWLPSHVWVAGAGPPPGREAHGSAMGREAFRPCLEGRRSPAQPQGNKSASGQEGSICMHEARQEEKQTEARRGTSSVTPPRITAVNRRNSPCSHPQCHRAPLTGRHAPKRCHFRVGFSAHMRLPPGEGAATAANQNPGTAGSPSSGIQSPAALAGSRYHSHNTNCQQGDTAQLHARCQPGRAGGWAWPG